MKKMFPQHFPPNEAELQILFNTALVAFDTNVLLRVYEFSRVGREALLEAIEFIPTLRRFLPHHVCQEYLRGRKGVMKKQGSSSSNLLDDVKNAHNKIVNRHKHNSFIDPETLKTLLNKCLLKIETELNKQKHERPDTLNQELNAKLETLFEGRIGEALPDNHVIYKEGEERYKKCIPPGWADNGKKGSDKKNTSQYGDLLIWKQLLLKATNTKTSCIFVCDDQKDDWWEDKVRPCPELVAEMKRESGQMFHLYTISEFIAVVAKIKNWTPARTKEATSETKPRVNSKYSELAHQLTFLTAFGSDHPIIGDREHLRGFSYRQLLEYYAESYPRGGSDDEAKIDEAVERYNYHFYRNKRELLELFTARVKEQPNSNVEDLLAFTKEHPGLVRPFTYKTLETWAERSLKEDKQ